MQGSDDVAYSWQWWEGILKGDGDWTVGVSSNKAMIESLRINGTDDSLVFIDEIDGKPVRLIPTSDAPVFVNPAKPHAAKIVKAFLLSFNTNPVT